MRRIWKNPDLSLDVYYEYLDLADFRFTYQQKIFDLLTVKYKKTG
jgi:hypothetical protein